MLTPFSIKYTFQSNSAPCDKYTASIASEIDYEINAPPTFGNPITKQPIPTIISSALRPAIIQK